MTDWNTNMDEAPRDGTRILLGRFKKGCPRDGRIAVDYWHTSKAHGFNGFGKFNSTHWPPTHWMPLPPPPVQP